ncbi:MAG: hypothetical protein ABR569_13415 [Gaiellaceae bacterium]
MPLLSGERIRDFNLIEQLARRGWRVSLFSLLSDRPVAAHDGARLRQLCEDVLLYDFREAGLGRAVTLAGSVLDERRAHLGDRWLDAEGVARLLGVERSYVYEHAIELGARRLGGGPKARLRFRLEDVEAALPCLPNKGSRSRVRPAVKLGTRRRVATALGTNVPLLPIAGSTLPRSGSR